MQSRNALFEANCWGLTGANSGAHDLANGAVNVLEGIPRIFGRKSDGKQRNLVFDPNNDSPSTNAYSAMQAVVEIYNPDQAKLLRKRFEKAQLPLRGFTHPVMPTYKNWAWIAMTSIVVIFLLIMLAIGVWVENPTNLGIFIFLTVLSPPVRWLIFYTWTVSDRSYCGKVDYPCRP